MLLPSTWLRRDRQLARRVDAAAVVADREVVDDRVAVDDPAPRGDASTPAAAVALDHVADDLDTGAVRRDAAALAVLRLRPPVDGVAVDAVRHHRYVGRLLVDEHAATRGLVAVEEPAAAGEAESLDVDAVGSRDVDDRRLLVAPQHRLVGRRVTAREIAAGGEAADEA